MASEHLLHLYQQIEGRVPNLAREEDLETSTSGGYLATIYISYKNTFGQSTRTLRILNSAVFRQTHPHTVYIYIYGSCGKTQPTSFLPRTFRVWALINKKHTYLPSYTIPCLTMMTAVPYLTSDPNLLFTPWVLHVCQRYQRWWKTLTPTKANASQSSGSSGSSAGTSFSLSSWLGLAPTRPSLACQV